MDNTTIRFFEHLPLSNPKEEIRLLRLQPGNDEEDIRCELLTYRFAEAPKYHAISYIWGDPNNLRSIFVNDDRMVVRYNCWDVLHQVRMYVDEATNLLLWTDAICIDQADIIEKSAQVQKMSDIYSHASQVLVCPGPPNDDSAFLLQQTAVWIDIKEWYEDNKECYDPKDEPAYHEWLVGLREDGRVRLIKALCSFGSRPYWDRAWIVQEMRLAKDTLLLCGSTPVSASHFFGIAFDLRQISERIPWAEGFDFRPTPFLDGILEKAGIDTRTLRMLPIETALWNTTTREELESLRSGTLSRMAGLQCSDSRDRIFALIKFLPWRTECGPPSTNYTKDPFEVAIDAVMRLQIDDPISEASGIDLIAGLLQILDIDDRRFVAHFPEKLTPGFIDAIAWRSAPSWPVVGLCSQCRLIKSIHKLKAYVKDWAPVQRNSEGNLSVLGKRSWTPELHNDTTTFHPSENGTSPLMVTLINDKLKEHTSKIGIVSFSTEPGDVVARISADIEETGKPICRHVVLREASNGIYQIMGHAYIPENLFLVPFPGLEPEADDISMYYEDTTLRLSIDLEDALEYLRTAAKPTHWRQQVEREFCKKPMSSFGKMRPPIEPDESYPEFLRSCQINEELYNFCLNCGHDFDTST